MQIVIEIPESEIPKQQDIIEIPLHFIDGNVCEAGGYGFMELPKGHGRLIDGDRFDVISWQHTSDDFNNGVMWLAEQIDNAPTIIEADIPTMYYPQVDGITPTVINNGIELPESEDKG